MSVLTLLKLEGIDMLKAIEKDEQNIIKGRQQCFSVSLNKTKEPEKTVKTEVRG